jgi:hypothetical protein
MGQVSRVQFDASNNGARNDDREASIFVDAKRASLTANPLTNSVGE